MHWKPWLSTNTMVMRIPSATAVTISEFIIK